MNKMDLNITINGVSYAVEVEKTGGSSTVPLAPVTPSIVAVPAAPVAAKALAPASEVAVLAGDTAIPAPMPGKVSKVNVKAGDQAKKGDVLLILEAMKMQNEISAPVDGTVKAVNISGGDNVKPGQVLVILSN
ncbi:biotin/lipoyl-containing protein [Propionispira raffinosivorans]|uniref:biotin/lipoyl-containing protein n=1 Tax=Propionispira raffinosivorans TaxID=86959 RepID=UPI00036FDD2B|nr:biotin/lipoyl-containing protein [Propionispira raffinosivorans]